MLIPAGTMAAADPCRVHRRLATATVECSCTRHPGRSPRVRTAAFAPAPPHLPDDVLVVTGFAVDCRLTHAAQPRTSQSGQMNLRIERVIEGRSSLCIPTSSPPSARSSDGSSVSARKTPSPRRGRLGCGSGDRGSSPRTSSPASSLSGRPARRFGPSPIASTATADARIDQVVAMRPDANPRGGSSYGDMSPAAVQRLMGYNGPVVSP